MKIRTALTIKNVCITASMLLVIFTVISAVSEHSRSRAFYHDLKGEAVTKAHLYLQNKVDAATMQDIYLNNRQFIDEVEVAIYTPDFEMLYHDAINNDIIKEDRQMIDRIVRDHSVELDIDSYQGVGLLYSYGGKDYVVTAAAYDGAGRENVRNLRMSLVALFFVALTLLFVACYLMARSALRPIRQITREAAHITSSEISRRLPIKNPNDELGELSRAINDLLTRLEKAFNDQKQFVSNVSHELRTPLAAVIAQLDLALQKPRSPEHYQRAITDALADARSMNSLISGLLNLAKTQYRLEAISTTDIRLDELLLDVRQRILTAHPDYKVDMIFDIDSDNESLITVHANTYLLSVAFANLIENNCKYSADRRSIIQISHWEASTIVRLTDCGSGISEADKARLFDLFYRGENTAGVEGHGIGLTLAHRIVTLFGGSLSVRSHLGEGTTFVVEMPHT